jgi:hypothetical protein
MHSMDAAKVLKWAPHLPAEQVGHRQRAATVSNVKPDGTPE